MRKCKWCGKEFEPRQGKQLFCTETCRVTYNAETLKLRKLIKRIAKKFDFEVKNDDKIIRAKMMLFSGDDVKRCPCDSANAKRFCGSAQCISDVVTDSHCHCSLFWRKNDVK